MKPQKPIKYAEQEILNGKSHQEIYDHIVATSQFNIHDVANMVRKIPTLEKRKKYNSLNAILLGIIAMSILDRILIVFQQLSGDGQDRVSFLFMFPIVSILLFYGIVKYKRTVHLSAGFLMAFATVSSGIRLLSHSDIFSVLGLFVSLVGAIIAFYLSVKLVSDYKIDKELQKNNPSQREGLITFIE